MTAQRRQRLGKLVHVMKRLKAYHEARHAGHMAEAMAAEREAGAIAERLDAADPMADLFPDLYHRRIDGALKRGRVSGERAQREARNVTTAGARADTLERAYREAADWDERDRADKDRLEFIQRPFSGEK